MNNQLIKYLLVSTVAMMAVNARPKCEMTDQQAEECGKKLMYITEDKVTFPKTDQDLLGHCKTLETGLECIKKYSKSCADPFVTQIMNIALKNADTMEKKYCKEEKGRKELLDAFLCVEHSDEHVSALRLCMEKFVVQMEHLKEVGGDHRIPATCCSFQLLDTCTKVNIGKMCSDSKKVDYISKFLNEMNSELISAGCGNFNSLAHCDSSMDKKEWQMLKDLVASNDIKEIKAKRVNTSPFATLKSVVSSLMDD